MIVLVTHYQRLLSIRRAMMSNDADALRAVVCKRRAQVNCHRVLVQNATKKLVHLSYTQHQYVEMYNCHRSLPAMKHPQLIASRVADVGQRKKCCVYTAICICHSGAHQN